MNIITVPSTPSTNTTLAEMAPELPHGTVLLTRRQSAGRGQRGNSWEAEPGKNLTMSMLLLPQGIAAAAQFAVSEAVALAVASLLDRFIDSARVKVKWPNDIYVDNRKIAGILIENVVAGASLVRCIAGIGLNINQREFLSNAPNPVSLIQLTGREENVEALCADLAETILTNMELAEADPAALHARYLSRLWRAEGPHPFAEPQGAPFMAEIAGVAPDGFLTLRLCEDGSLRRYAFKEVAFVL